MQMNFKRYFSHAALSLAVVMACGAVGTAKAASPQTAALAVSAHVAASCIISVPTALAFGEYDTNATAALQGQGIISTTCTNGSAAKITMTQGDNPEAGSTGDVPLRQMLGDSGDLLAYQLYQDASTTIWGETAATGKDAAADGTPVEFTVYGVVAPGQIVKEGSYNDVVMATVTF